LGLGNEPLAAKHLIERANWCRAVFITRLRTTPNQSHCKADFHPGSTTLPA
jgi:hypothetical protein